MDKQSYLITYLLVDQVVAASVDCYFEISDINIGTDTGGSCRYPAKMIGKYGFKPSFGCISRAGLISYAQSLDTVGLIVNCLYKLEESLEILYQYDKYDSCMIKHIYEKYVYKGKIKILVLDANKMNKSQIDFIERIKLNNKFHVQYLDNNIVLNTILVYIVYEIISSIELFSALSRYDRVKYKDLKEIKELDSIYEDRFNYFGSNIRGKIMQGALFLYNKELRDKYYLVWKQRSSILYSFINLFQEYKEEYDDILVLTPDVDNTNVRALECYYMLDNIAGTPCLSVPINCGREVSRDKYVSILVHGNIKKDNLVIYFAKEIQ